MCTTAEGATQTPRRAVRSEVFIVRSTGSLPAIDNVEGDWPRSATRCLRTETPMYLATDDDLPLLAARLKLGLPLRGFDGRDIPLRGDAGDCLGPIDAAHALLRSGASLLPADQAEPFVATVCERARTIEAAACVGGEAPAVIAARVTAVLVSGAVRASVLARGRDVSPSAMNRATLSWYQVSELRRRELLEADLAEGVDRLSA
jgi:hypothetical protein